MRIAVSLVALLSAATSLEAQVRSAAVDITAPDGANIRATYHTPGRAGPGMLLLHQCNMDRTSWRELATALAARGVHVLAIDYRGYGESAERTDDRSRIGPIRQKWPGDIDSAFAVLKRLPSVDVTRLAAGGASCGVNNAVQLATRNPDVRALMLLSGNTSADGIAWLERHPAMPIFGAASTEDGMAVPNLERIVATSRHQRSTMHTLQDAGHGVPMFTVDTTLVPAIADWVVAVLR